MRSIAVSALLIIALALSGCARFMSGGVSEDSPVPPVLQMLKNAEQLQKEGKFPDALKAYRKVIQEQPGSDLAATAKFNTALIYVEVENPEKDYALAQAEFDAFITQFPLHRRVAEAKSWRQVIKLALDAKKENDRLNKNIEQLKQLDVKQEERRLGK